MKSAKGKLQSEEPKIDVMKNEKGKLKNAKSGK